MQSSPMVAHKITLQTNTDLLRRLPRRFTYNLSQVLYSACLYALQ